MTLHDYKDIFSERLSSSPMTTKHIWQNACKPQSHVSNCNMLSWLDSLANVNSSRSHTFVCYICLVNIISSILKKASTAKKIQVNCCVKMHDKNCQTWLLICYQLSQPLTSMKFNMDFLSNPRPWNVLWTVVASSSHFRVPSVFTNTSPL